MAYKPDKHGRDHCPGGEDPIPCFLMPAFKGVVTTSTLTIEDGGPYAEMIFDEWENQDESVFDVNTAGVPAKVTSVTLRKAGVYAITVRLVLEDPWTGNFRIIINDWGDWPLAAFYDYNSLVGQNEEAPTFSVVRTYPPPVALDLGATDPSILIQVAQFGASGDRDLSSFGSTLEIIKLGNAPLTPPVIGP